MPNLCSNHVIISGEAETIALLADSFQRFFEHQNKPYVEIERYIGFTEFADTLLDQEFDKEKYDIYKYDTKWIDFWIEDQQEREFTMNGTSAWSPPITFWLMLSEKYDLHIYTEFEESGFDFGGYIQMQSGEINEEEEYSFMQWQYITCSDYFFSMIDDQMNDYHFFEDYKTAEDFLKDFTYLKPEDKKYITERYNNLKLETKEHENN